MVSDYWERRTLCSDESCIGAIGEGGFCRECGKAYVIKDDVAEENDWNWEERILCDDDSCIGTIGSNGRCNECDRISIKYEEYKKYKSLDMSGYIYILSNPSLQKNYLKIGKTVRLPKARALEISQRTGIPTSFKVVYHTQFTDCHRAEKLIHKRLKFCRVSRKREFFEIPLEKVIPIIEEIRTNLNKK